MLFPVGQDGQAEIPESPRSCCLGAHGPVRQTDEEQGNGHGSQMVVVVSTGGWRDLSEEVTFELEFRCEDLGRKCSRLQEEHKQRS